MIVSYSSLAMIILIAAITPGPNNFIVLALSMTRGWREILLAIGAIVIGTLIVLMLTALGLGELLSEFPALRVILLAASCLYLGVQGIKMIFTKPESKVPDTPVRPALSLVVFQLINPKCWILVSTCYAAALPGTEANILGSPLFTVSVLILLITSPCLAVWALVGHFFNNRFGNRLSRTYVIPFLGGTLLLSTAGLFTMI